MVTKIDIINPINSSFNYIKCKSNRGTLKLPKTIEFKKGKNILVGENGCGKTTIINIIAHHTFCNKSEYSKIDQYTLDKWFDFDTFRDGIDVHANYNICTYKTFYEEEKNNDDVLDNFKSFVNSFFSNELSSGENTLRTIQSLFEVMFSGEHIKFDNSFLKQNVNDLWAERFNLINEYFKRNHIEESEPTFTVLLDEPDRNLSVKNILALYDVLSTPKDKEQIIAAIHNPILIYKLSKLEHINFIELTENYINNIKQLIES